MLFKLILYVKACPTCSSTSFLLKAEEMSEEWCGRAPLSWTFRWLSEFCFHQQCWCEYSCPLAHLYFGEIPSSASATSKRICFRNFGYYFQIVLEEVIPISSLYKHIHKIWECQVHLPTFLLGYIIFPFGGERFKNKFVRTLHKLRNYEVPCHMLQFVLFLLVLLITFLSIKKFKI